MKKEQIISNLKQLRYNYQLVKNALPWLDMAIWEDDPPAFPAHAAPIRTDYIKAAGADPALTEHLPRLQAESAIRLLRLTPEKYPPADCGKLFGSMQESGMPLVILHTDLEFDAIRKLAGEYPRLNIIIESGPRKLLYHYTAVKKILKDCPNVYLCNYNFSNWQALEELANMKLAAKLLYGSHMPLYSDDASMGPIIMGDLPWQTKCDIAGNNLRRLLGMPPLPADEVKFNPPAPFIIDAHAHNLQKNAPDVYGMPTPDQGFTPADWLQAMDATALEQLFLIPGEVLFDPKISSREYTAELRRYAPRRFFYMEMFNPFGDADHVKRVRAAMADPACVGIKIHPVTHKIAADEDVYAPVYKIAATAGKPIMTHSWEISDYNPEQYKGHPDRFRRYLPEMGNVPFVLGHAGGRPSAFEATVKVCRDFPNVHVDLAGDYIHNGVMDAFASAIGHQRIIFGTDVDWFDPKCMLGIALGSAQSDDNLADILRANAERVYH